MQASLVSTYRVCCNKRSRKFDFGVLECSGNWTAALERERCLFQIQQNYLHESSKLGSYSFQITTYNYHYYSRTTSYFQFFTDYILVQYAFRFSYWRIMTRFLINAEFWGAALIRWRHLLEGGTSFDLRFNDKAFKARRLLEKIRYNI